jgi:hypothetical protein
MGFVQRYQKRISGPPMDRVNIHPDILRCVPLEKLAATIRAQVEVVGGAGRALCPAGQAPCAGQQRYRTRKLLLVSGIWCRRLRLHIPVDVAITGQDRTTLADRHAR